MGIENKFARFMRNTGPARFLFPLGLVLIVVGVILFSFQTHKYVQTDGTITAIKELPLDLTEDTPQQEYEISITYSVDGKEYPGILSGVTEPPAVGESVKVYYDPDNPETISNVRTPAFVPYILLGLGAAAIGIAVWRTVAAFKKSKALDQSAGAFPSAEFENFKTRPGVTEYYFRFDGNSLKPGFIVEDAARNVLYEGKMLKQAIVGARPYEFVNHLTGKTEQHEIGHITTQTYNNETFSAKSWFKFDGKNVWDLLHERGVRLSTSVISKFPHLVYNAAKNGSAFAVIETSSQYVHEDEEAQHKLAIPTGSMFYRFWTSSDDMDLLFLTIFAISETDQTIVE